MSDIVQIKIIFRYLNFMGFVRGDVYSYAYLTRIFYFGKLKCFIGWKRCDACDIGTVNGYLMNDSFRMRYFDVKFSFEF